MNKWLILITFISCCGSAVAQRRPDYKKARRELVEKSIVAAGVKDRRVIRAMLTTKRHEFVSARQRSQAYFDMALPIGGKQTISSPFIVSFMTQSLETKPTDKVLEIGTGSGYQAAILSPLVKEVYSIEIVELLGRRAARTLKRLRYKNVFTKIGDGFKGWPEHAPFDKIIVTCSPEKVPKPLVQQLREGGLMVIPVGERFQQTLYVMKKQQGKIVRLALRPTLFVPMTGAAESRRKIQPNPSKPHAENGSFELKPTGNGFMPGWYYQRRLLWEKSDDAPDGKHYVTFKNQDSGRSAHLLQGFAIDGRIVPAFKLSTWVKHTAVLQGRSVDELPYVAVTFYDKNRRDLGNRWLGPFKGTSTWTKTQSRIRVPKSARSGILRIGLFGATGEVSFDKIEIRR